MESFDVSHLLIELQASFLRYTKGKIQSTHMANYDRKNELHWLPGEEVIDWNELLLALLTKREKFFLLV